MVNTSDGEKRVDEQKDLQHKDATGGLKRGIALSPSHFVLSREATKTNFIVFGLTRSWLRPMTYST
jgi:hypothetical protein